MQLYDTTSIQQEGWSVSEPEKNRGSEEEYGKGEGGQTTEAVTESGFTVIIYGLFDPETGELRYIGKAKPPLQRRLRQHLHASKNVYRAAWIKSVKARGLRPVIEELERIENSNDLDWQHVERFWIAYLRFIGCRLTNLEEGGIGGGNRSRETKEKIGAGNRGRARSPEAIEKLRQSRLGKKLTPEHCANMSKAVKGKPRGPRAPGVMEKVAAKNRGKKRPRTPEHQAKLTQLQIGRKRSPETRAKISASQLGKKRGTYSADRCAAISASLKGRIVPEDQKQKMREAAIRRWATHKGQLPAIAASMPLSSPPSGLFGS